MTLENNCEEYMIGAGDELMSDLRNKLNSRLSDPGSREERIKLLLELNVEIFYKKLQKDCEEIGVIKTEFPWEVMSYAIAELTLDQVEKLKQKGYVVFKDDGDITAF